MSQTLFSFGINTEEIQSVFGSKNKILFNQIIATFAFKAYQDFLPEGFTLSTKEAIRQLVFGETLSENDYHAYGYALICICDAFGDTLPYNYEYEETEDIKAETIPLINTILAAEFQCSSSIETFLFPDNQHPFPIPKIETFPKIGFIKKTDLQSLLEKLEAITIDDEMIENFAENEAERSLAYQNLQAFINNINNCIEFEYDYISFFH